MQHRSAQSRDKPGEEMRSRHSGLLRGALLSLIGCLGWATPGLADHDRIPDPPPRFTGQKLQAVPKLDGTAITVSGLSSGGFFAHQFHIAFSKLVTGAGIIAGGPFGCMESIPNPYFWFWTVPLDRVSAATLAYSHYFGDRYFGLRPSPPNAAAGPERASDSARAWTMWRVARKLAPDRGEFLVWITIVEAHVEPPAVGDVPDVNETR
jgi:hypothetical protein